MATSYKTLYQEAQQEIDSLRATIQRLRHLNDELSATLMNARSETGPSRQIVDLAGIARHMRVERFTPQQWKQRDYLPPVDFPEIREPLWYASTIKEKFAIPTGRIWYDTVDPNAFARLEVSPAA